MLQVKVNRCNYNSTSLSISHDKTIMLRIYSTVKIDAIKMYTLYISHD